MKLRQLETLRERYSINFLNKIRKFVPRKDRIQRIGDAEMYIMTQTTKKDREDSYSYFINKFGFM